MQRAGPAGGQARDLLFFIFLLFLFSCAAFSFLGSGGGGCHTGGLGRLERGSGGPFGVGFEADGLETACCAEERGYEGAEMRLGAVDGDVGEKEAACVVWVGDFGCVAADVDVVGCLVGPGRDRGDG